MNRIASRLARWIAAAFAVSAAATPICAAPENLDGFWMDSDGEVIIEVVPCGPARCGHVVWLKQPNGADGLPLRDIKNADAKLKNRPVCGLEVVTGFKKQTGDSWGDGTVYVSDEGASYSGKAEVLSATQIKVTGYIGFAVFGESEVWTKVTKPFDRCSTSAAPKPESKPWDTTTTAAPQKAPPTQRAVTPPPPKP